MSLMKSQMKDYSNLEIEQMPQIIEKNVQQQKDLLQMQERGQHAEATKRLRLDDKSDSTVPSK